MSTTKVAWNPTTKVAQLLPNTYTIMPLGSTLAGSFVHDDDDNDVMDVGVNHVIYQHVQDVLYKIGVLDMQSVTILYNIPVTGISILPATATKVIGQTQQITATITPADASAAKINWTTSDATKATVSSTGLVTAVAAGSATITATINGGFTDTTVMTITT